jgi:hypothetical protein
LMVLFEQLGHLQYHIFLNNNLTFDWWGQFYGYLHRIHGIRMCKHLQNQRCSS